VPARIRIVAACLLALGLAAACQADRPPDPTALGPGTSAAPREVNLIAKDYLFLPDALDLFPGETVLLHVINGGLEVHEAVIGDARVQDAWELAEGALAGGPPGPTPVVSVPPEVRGIRIVVRSGERVDVTWTVPADVAAGGAWVVGCHIPGHWAQGMQIPVHWSGASAESAAPSAGGPSATGSHAP
jgi:FtsP/CotA-like multicopper oxidase with cupredoxin domain